MTYCISLARPLLKRVEAGETLDELSKSICSNSAKAPEATDTPTQCESGVARPQYRLQANGETSEQAQPPPDSSDEDELICGVRTLVDRFGFDAVQGALTLIQNQNLSQNIWNQILNGKEENHEQENELNNNK